MNIKFISSIFAFTLASQSLFGMDKLYLNEDTYVVVSYNKDQITSYIDTYSLDTISYSYKHTDRVIIESNIPKSRITFQVISSSKQYLFLGLSNGEIKIINMEMGWHTATIKAYDNSSIKDIIFVPSKQKIITISEDNVIKIFDQSHYKLKAEIKCENSKVAAAVVHFLSWPNHSFHK
jgi:WD40 repeat protein